MSYRDDLHNEMNPDMRSFGSKGTSSINPHDEADKQKAEEQAEARENADDEDQDEIDLINYDQTDALLEEEEEVNDSSGNETEHYEGY